MSPKKFFSELKRRNVYKVAVAYAIVGWLLTQAGSIYFPTFEAPTWVMKVFVVAITGGFLIALILAWAVEMTPEGPKLTKNISRKTRFPRRTSRTFVALIASMAIMAGGLLVFQFVWKGAGGSIAFKPKSIAVLPLENLSDDKKDAFLAAGLQDDVLAGLAKVKDLKVIARNWVSAYGDNVPRNLRKITKDLGVSHILEGSVRRVEDHVHVSVRLVHTAGDKPIWAKNYDRTLADFFTLQVELVFEIASALQIPLTPEEKTRVEAKPTNNSQAWLSYQRGREIQLRPETSRANFLSAESFYRQAVALDPDFVLAFAQLSLMQAQRYEFFDKANEALLDEARENAEEALRLDASSAEAHLARARCAQLRRDYRLTRSDLRAAVRLRPDDGSVRLAAAVLQQQLGWEEEASANYTRAVELGPREAKIFLNHGYLLYQRGQEAEARWALDHALSLEPKSVLFCLVRAVAEISWSGETSHARKILAGLPTGKDPDGRVTSAYCTLAILERNFPEALRLLQTYPKETLPTVESGGLGEQQRKVEAEAAIRFYAGDYARACAYFESIRPGYEAAVKNKPQSVSDHAALAVLYAWMSRCQVDKRSNETGWKERAKAEAGRIIELNASAAVPIERAYILALAKIYAWASEPDLAWQQIEQFRDLPPSGYSEHNFHLDPVWDPLRSDPRFQKLVQKKTR